jgi:RHS repeat-associated protein
MKTLLKGLMALVALCLCASASAQTTPTAAKAYCGTNSDYQTSCFKSHAEAEEFIRADPNGNHPARKLLVQDRNPLGQGQTLPSEDYHVPSKPGIEGPPGYRAGDNNGASTAYVQVACEVTGTVALYQGFGPVSNCSNQPSLCTYGYYCSTKEAITTAIAQGVRRPNCAPGTAWESVAPPSSPQGWNPGPPDSKPNYYPPNSNTFYYHRSYYGQWFGGWFDFQYQTGTDCSGTGGGRLIEYMVRPVTCPAGYTFQSGDVPDASSVCKSPEWGYITPFYSPTDDRTPCPDSSCGRYGDPILPSTGATLQTPAGWDLESMLGVNLTYNSYTSDSPYSILGGGWNSILQTRYAGYDGSRRNYSIVEDDGNIEVYYTPTGYTPLRPLGATGKVMWSSVANGCEYIIHEANRRVVVECNQASYGRIRRVEYPNAPQKSLTFNWATADGTGPLGPIFANTISSVTRADGRELDLHYGMVNTDPNCSNFSPAYACNVRRLIGISDSDGNLTTLAYNTDARLELITYPDGNRERFEYGNPADVCPASMPGACDSSPNALMMRTLLTGTFIETQREDGGYDSVRRGTYQYDNRGRAIRTSLPGDALRTEVSYGADGTPTVTRFVDATHFSKRQIVPTPVGMWHKPGTLNDTSSTGEPLRSMRTEYDANGYLSKSVNAKGIETLWTYSINALPTQRVEANNDLPNRRTTQWDWDPTLHAMLEERVYNSSAATLPGTLVLRRTISYNSRGQQTAECRIDPGNQAAMSYVCGSAPNAPVGVRQSRYTYCEADGVTAGTCPFIGQLLSVDGPRTDVDDVTTFSYYQASAPSCAPAAPCDYHAGDLRQVTNAVGQTTQYLRYDGAGRVLSLRSAAGAVTDLDYSPRGWLKSSKRRGPDDSMEVDDGISTFGYNSLGILTSLVAEDGISTTFEYDDAGRLTKVVDGSGARKVLALDMDGHPVAESSQDATGNSKQWLSGVYDDLGRLRSLVDANNNAVQFSFDSNGNADLTTDRLNRVQDSDVDSLDRVIKVVANAAGTASEKSTTILSYDVLDKLKSETDPKSLVTSYSYNGLGDLTQLSSPDTGSTIYGYDAAGNRTSEMRADNVAQGYVYDALNRLTAQTFTHSAQNVGLVYDVTQSDCLPGETFGVGRLTKITDGSGNTRYCYDQRGHRVRQVQSVASGSTLTVGTTYNSADRLVAITYPSGAVVTYARDANGRINRIDAKPTPTAAQVVLVGNASYLPFGPLNVLTFGNGRSLTKSYDFNYGIDRVADSATSNPLSEDFTLDPAGNISGLTERTSATATVSRTYSYDGLDRLTAQKNGATTVEGFSYNSTGDRVSKTAGATTNYTYPASSHRLSSVGNTPRSYNATGETILIGSGGNKGTTLTYDDRHRLADVLVNNKKQMTNQYNARGERVAKIATSAANSRQFVYDDSGHLLGEYTLTGVRVKEYVWLDETLVAVLSSFDNSTYQFVETDHLGSPRAVIHPSKNVAIWRWDVNPTAFGEHVPNANPDGDRLSYMLNLRFPGQYLDDESGLAYNYFRDYDPKTGRYIESDPVGLDGGPSTFGYVGGNPFNGIDPAGLSKITGTWISLPRFNIYDKGWDGYDFVPVHVSEWGYAKFIRIYGHIKGFVNIDVRCQEDCGRTWEIHKRIFISYSGHFDVGPNLIALYVGARAGPYWGISTNLLIGGASLLQAELHFLTEAGEKVGPYVKGARAKGPTAMCYGWEGP